MEIIPQATDTTPLLVVRGDVEPFQCLDQLPLHVVDGRSHLLHRCHAVRLHGEALQLGVFPFADLGEDVWILRRREHPVEVGFRDPLANGQDISRGEGRGE